MKRTVLILVLAMLMVFAVSGVASAAVNYTLTHSGFTGDTAACAGCHVTHSANVAYLLIGTGTTQTAFCYICHEGDSSPYDVEDGMIQKKDAPSNTSWLATDVVPSMAGGFGFKSAGKAYSQYTATSRHDVDTPTVAGVVYNEAQIPGGFGAGTEVGSFRCGMCHDPHGTNTANSRLLRETIFGATYNNVVLNVYGGAGSNAFQVQNYGTTLANAQAINNWCGTCHDNFNVGNDAGKTIGASKNNHYRHPVGVNIPTTTGFDTSLDTGVPLSGSAISCLTCHRAHGSSAQMTSGYTTSWRNDDNALKYGSALLRRNDRGVCSQCHGGAQRNLENI